MWLWAGRSCMLLEGCDLLRFHSFNHRRSLVRSAIQQYTCISVSQISSSCMVNSGSGEPPPLAEYNHMSLCYTPPPRRIQPRSLGAQTANQQPSSILFPDVSVATCGCQSKFNTISSFSTTDHQQTYWGGGGANKAARIDEKGKQK